MNTQIFQQKIFTCSSILINESSEYDDIVTCGVGGRIWNSSVILASFLKNKNIENYLQLENKTILEIGAGAGICGLVCATNEKVKKVIISDRDPGCLKLIEKNLELNFRKVIYEKIEIAPLDWSNLDELTKFKDSFDVLIGSDIIYSLSMIDGLLMGLDFLCGKETDVVLALADRGGEGSDYDYFMKKLVSSGKWKVDIVPDEFLDEKSYKIFILCLKKI